jgi:hypothetical protein
MRSPKAPAVGLETAGAVMVLVGMFAAVGLLWVVRVG